MALQQFTNLNFEDIKSRSGFIQKYQDAAGVNWNDHKQKLENVNNTSKLVAGMRKMPGNSVIAQAYNNKLDYFNTLGKAIDLNVSFSNLPEQSHAIEAVNGLYHAFGGVKDPYPDNDKVIETWDQVKEANGIVEDPKQQVREGDYEGRTITESIETG